MSQCEQELLAALAAGRSREEKEWNAIHDRKLRAALAASQRREEREWEAIRRPLLKAARPFSTKNYPTSNFSHREKTICHQPVSQRRAEFHQCVQPDTVPPHVNEAVLEFCEVVYSPIDYPEETEKERDAAEALIALSQRGEPEREGPHKPHWTLVSWSIAGSTDDYIIRPVVFDPGIEGVHHYALISSRGSVNQLMVSDYRFSPPKHYVCRSSDERRVAVSNALGRWVNFT